MTGPCDAANMAAAAALDDWEQRVCEWESAPGETSKPWAHPGNTPAEGGHVLDAWYLDDGLVLTHPMLAVPFLEAFDRRSDEKGAERNRQKTKVAMLVAKAEVETHTAEWQLDKMRELADVCYEPESMIALGAETMGGAAAVKQFREKTRVVKAMLRRIPLCQDAQVELVLQNACLGGGKINHLLRANGTELAECDGVLREFDIVQVRATGLGGVGLISANLASIIMAMSCVFQPSDLIQELESAQQRALSHTRRLLGPHEQQLLEELLGAAAERAATDWQNLRAGRTPARGLAPRVAHSRVESAPEPDDGQDVAMRAVLEAGHLRAEPDEMGRTLAASTLSGPHLQREIGLLVEATSFNEFFKRASEADDRTARRLTELLDGGTSHDWLWKVNPCEGSRLAEEDYLLALGSRLGAELVPAGEVSCALCGEMLDAAAAHGLCCSKAESTRGHYAVVGAVADGLVLADPALQTEVRGLVPTSDLPADILTNAALPGTQTALDITIAAPDAHHAGPDACAAAYRRKMRRYSDILPALRRAGVIFQPLVWSAEGRPHPATVRILECALRMVRARRGEEAVAELRGRWRSPSPSNGGKRP